MPLLTDFEERSREVVGRIASAVVAVGGRGSGIVTHPGLVVTNAHNIAAEEVPVGFADGDVLTGRVAGVDADGDLAVLSVDTRECDPLEWLDEPAAVGGIVFAAARSRAGGLRLTVGTVSAIDQSFRGPGGRRITGAIEHTAPLARGSSGGPIVDGRGRLVGLNTSRLADGFYLALPADDVLRRRVEALGAGDTPQPRRLGIGVAPAPIARRLRASVGLAPLDGVLVRAVADDSPADRAGLRVGDLIVAAAGEAVSDVDDVHRALEALDGDASLPLTVVRGAEELAVAVAFGPTREEGAV